MRICNSCGISKDESEFGKDKRSPDGLEKRCKKCCKERILKASRTRKGLLSKIYTGMKSHSKVRNHEMPQFTKQELGDWLFNNEKFEILYNEWIKSEYNIKLIPSIDRKYNDIGYTLDNIQLMTWKENNCKKHYKSK